MGLFTGEATDDYPSKGEHKRSSHRVAFVRFQPLPSGYLADRHYLSTLSRVYWLLGTRASSAGSRILLGLFYARYHIRFFDSNDGDTRPLHASNAAISW